MYNAFMDYSFRNKDGSNIKGWLSEEQAQILYDCDLKAPTPRVLELGSFVGKSAIVLASAMKKRSGFLMCIDFFIKNSNYITPEGTTEVIPDRFVSFWSNIKERNLENHVITIKGYHNTVLPTLGGNFGMIFIDGGHMIQDTLFIAINSWERLDEGGFLVFHDYGHKDYPDVKLCADVLKAKWKRDFVKVSKNSSLVVLQK